MQHVNEPAPSYRDPQRVVMCAAALAAAILIAGAALILNSAQTEATPNKVTAKKPCGSCHPPNKPPRR